MKHPNRATLVVLAVSACLAEAGELRLKTRTIATETGMESSRIFSAGNAVGRRLTAERSHWLIAIEGPAAPVLEEIVRRGGRVLSHIPDNGFVVSAPETMSWDRLALAYRDWLEAGDKISPLVQEQLLLIGDSTGEGESPAARRQLLLVRFHRDVEAWQADGILAAEQLEGRAHASLEAVDRLVEAGAEQIARLSLWDEVEYIFPAPEPMRNGEAFLVCGGVLSGEWNGELQVSMLAAVYGAGWDGAGRGRADLTYSFGALPGGLAAETVRQEVRRALDEWSRVVAVTFRETTSRQSSRNLDVLFATGEHGDPFPFVAGSTTLGHAFYPAPPNAEPLAGDIHLNTAFSWSVGGTWDLYSLVLHEAGHSLGIGHTDAPGSVMYPYYQRAEGLKAEDIASIRQLYADADGPASPAPTPVIGIAIASPTEGAHTTLPSMNFSGSLANAAAGVAVDYLNEATGARGACLLNATRSTWSCAAIPLRAGDNAISVRAVQNGQSAQARRVVVREAEADVVLSITNPPGRITTSATSFTLSGNAQHASGVASVRWTLNGQSGEATLAAPNQNSTTWSATTPLAVGPNEITMRALSRSGLSASRSVTIERTAPAPALNPTNPVIDRTPPQMTVQTPIGTFIFTSAPRMTFRGSATDNLGVTRVSWRNSAGGQSGDASLSAGSNGVQWTFDVNLAAGFNNIEIRAWDAAGNASGYTATVRRY